MLDFLRLWANYCFTDIKPHVNQLLAVLSEMQKPNVVNEFKLLFLKHRKMQQKAAPSPVLAPAQVSKTPDALRRNTSAALPVGLTSNSKQTENGPNKRNSLPSEGSMDIAAMGFNNALANANNLSATMKEFPAKTRMEVLDFMDIQPATIARQAFLISLRRKSY